jgi:hypothetical protein
VIVISRMTGERYRVVSTSRNGRNIAVRGIRYGHVWGAPASAFDEEDPAIEAAIEAEEERDERDFQAGKEAAWND